MGAQWLSAAVSASPDHEHIGVVTVVIKEPHEIVDGMTGANLQLIPALDLANPIELDL
jgi:hypothetical protein